MKKIVVTLFVGILLLLSGVVAAGTEFKPDGKWIQYDDATKKPHSIIQIYQQDGVYFGKILETFALNGKPPRKVCDLCKGEMHNAPIIGLVIMNNFKQLQANNWGDGTIVDPSSGNVYSCKFSLSADGKIMKVRGFIGVSLLGRTQYWVRQTEE